METVLRVAFVYVFIIIILRVLGKRELSQMSPMELVMLLLIPELVAQGLVGEDFSMTNAVIAVSTLAVLVFTTSTLVHRFKRVGELVEGRPSLVVDHGRPINEAMDRERLPIDELITEIRKAGIERLEDVKWGILETDGRIAIIGYGPDDVPVRKNEEMVT